VTPPDSPTRVLLLDTEESFGHLLGGYLAEQGWELVQITDGREALRQWDELSPQLLLMDLDGEEMDGFELLEEVLRKPDPPPVVICTRQPGVRGWSPETVAALGIAAATVRPIRFPELFEVLADALDS
jgi:DNA-binding response OmpR family regulator